MEAGGEHLQMGGGGEAAAMAANETEPQAVREESEDQD